MLQCKNTSSLFERTFCINHILHPHRSRFIGIGRNRRYLLQISKCGEFQTFFRAPIDWVAAVTRFSMSKSSHRLKDTKDLRYLKWWQKVAEPSSTSIWRVSLSSSYSAPSWSCLVRAFCSSCLSLVVMMSSCSSSRVLLKSTLPCWRVGKCESKTLGGGKKTHSVLEGEPFRLMWISSPKVQSVCRLDLALLWNWHALWIWKLRHQRRGTVEFQLQWVTFRGSPSVSVHTVFLRH